MAVLLGDRDDVAPRRLFVCADTPPSLNARWSDGHPRELHKRRGLQADEVLQIRALVLRANGLIRSVVCRRGHWRVA